MLFVLKIDVLDVGKKLYGWIQHGIPELEKRCMGLGRSTGTVLRHPEYLSDPHKVMITYQLNLCQIFYIIKSDENNFKIVFLKTILLKVCNQLEILHAIMHLIVKYHNR